MAKLMNNVIEKLTSKFDVEIEVINKKSPITWNISGNDKDMIIEYLSPLIKTTTHDETSSKIELVESGLLILKRSL